MSCMSYTSTSSPLSISGVGFRVSPYSEWTVSPVRGSFWLATDLPASFFPSSPCSGANSETSLTPGALARISRVSRPRESAPVWLVMSPTRLPLSGSNWLACNVSMPSCTARRGARARNNVKTAQKIRMNNVVAQNTENAQVQGGRRAFPVFVRLRRGCVAEGCQREGFKAKVWVCL